MTARRQAAAAWWRRWAGLALLLWAGQVPAATVSTPMELSAPPPADAGGAGRTLDKALTGADTNTGDRSLDMALDMQRADLAARNRPGADPAAAVRPAAVPQAAQAITPALALPAPGAGNGMSSALSLGGLAGNGAGLATPRPGGREADQRWNGAQGSGSNNPTGSAQGPGDLDGARRLLAALHGFVVAWRAWLLGGLALGLVGAGLAQLVRKSARHRTGQSAIEQAARRADKRGSSRSRRSRRS